ncbi:MAG: alanine racemase [Spirochaetota bacterium]
MLRLTIDRDKITENYRSVQKTCDGHGISLVVVAKICLTQLDIVQPIIDSGVRIVADSNLANLSSLPGNVERMLLRSSLAEMREGLANCDYVLLSELSHFETCAEVRHAGPRHAGPRRGAFISVEAGDLRDGVTAEELPGFVDRATRVRGGPRIAGFAANYGCLRGFVPDLEDLVRFRELCDRSASRSGLGGYEVSIGGTTVFDMLSEGSLDGLADQIRIGEAIYFGYNMSLAKKIPGLHDDALILTAEVIEAREKLVSDDEPHGLNAFGHHAFKPHTGMRLRAILNFGELAAPTRSLEPLLPGAFFEGATHDHAVLDITDCEDPPRPGDLVKFRTNYNSAAQAMLSPYVEKVMATRALPAREERG